ncbi:MAG: HepT-like ribonuclease domain-containing protein [Candidatus Hydrogenedentota bacterium]
MEKQDAVIRNLEIIGEAVKNLSPYIRKKQKDIEWRNFAGMRDKIIHFYFGIKWDIVWSVIKNKIPELKTKIKIILRDLEK